MVLPIDLAAYVPSISTATLPPGTVVGIVTAGGTLVWRNLDPQTWVGKKVDAQLPVMRLISTRGELTQGAGLDGVNRFVAVAPVPGADWYAYVGIPSVPVYAAANSQSMRNAILGLLCLLGLLGVAVLLARRIERPLQELVGTVRAIRGGKPGVRAKAAGVREVAELAGEFNLLLDHLDEAVGRLGDEKELNRNIIETSPVGICIFDEQGACVAANPAVARHIGATMTQVLAQNYHQIESWKRSGIYALARKAMESNAPLADVFPATSSFGKEVWLGVTFCRLDIGGRQYLMLLTSDLTEAKRAELAVEQSEQKYRTLVEQATDGIFLTDPQGRITAINDTGCSMVGCPREDVIGKVLTDFLDPEELARRPIRYKLMREGKPLVVDRQLLRRDATRLQAEISARMLPDGSIQGIVRDIGERMRAQTELARLAQTLEARVVERTSELDRANKELEAFSYSVAHDLRSPIRAMVGFSSILLAENKDRLDRNSIDYIQRINAGAIRMNSLIDDLLKLSQVARAEMHREDFSLSALAAEVVESLKDAEPTRTVQVSIQPDLHVCGDRGLVRIAMENLLGNAWKFTSRKNDARIEFGLAQTESGAAYCVRDNGAGFDMKYVDKLFGAFQRLHRQGEFDGTGIGLSIVQRVVSKHGGRVWAEGVPDQGATFHFTLGTPAIAEQ